MQIISRAQWGARYQNGASHDDGTPVILPMRWQDNWLHHSVTTWLPPDATLAQEIAAVREIERIGQGEFGQGISYTRVIPASGRVYEGHGLDRRGAHTYRRNDSGRAVCLIGNYETNEPTAAQLRAAAAVVREWHAAGYCPQPALSGGHRDVYATACPGRNAYAAIPDINRLAGSGEPLDLEDDMFTDEDRELLKNIKGYLYAGGADADADDPLAVPGVSRRSVFGRTVDMHGALASAWERTGKNVGQLLADLAERPDVTLSPEQVQEISDNLANAGLPAAFVEEFRRAIGAPTGGTA